MSTLIDNATIKIRRDTAGNWSSNNPTPLQGEWCLETDTGNVKIGDGSTVWNGLGYRQQLPFTYSLSSNKTHTLPAITGAPQTESVYWTGGGTYKLTLAVTDGATVGGETASTWEGEGKGHILVESDGSNWQVREYEDTEDWHEVGASGEPAFENGWANYGGAWVLPRFKRYRTISEDIISVQFMIKNGTAKEIFTLPTGYRPKDGLVMGFGNVNDVGSRIYITIAGVVVIENYSSAFSQGAIDFRVRR